MLCIMCIKERNITVRSKGQGSSESQKFASLPGVRAQSINSDISHQFFNVFNLDSSDGKGGGISHTNTKVMRFNTG